MPHSQLLPAKNVIASDFFKRTEERWWWWWREGEEGGEITGLIDFPTTDSRENYLICVDYQNNEFHYQIRWSENENKFLLRLQRFAH